MLKLLDITVQFQTITFIPMYIHTAYCKNWSHGSEVDRGDKSMATSKPYFLFIT